MQLKRWQKIIKDKLKKTVYIIKAPVRKKIVVISDVHGLVDKEIIYMVKNIAPDVITMPGDIFEGRGPHVVVGDDSISSRFLNRIVYFIKKTKYLIADAKKYSFENVYGFLQELSGIAPVLMSLGNHEGYVDFKYIAEVCNHGITLLHNSYIRVGDIVFGGVSSKQICSDIDKTFLKNFEAESGYKILLCHHPEYYEEIHGDRFDLVLSGHTHGGQIAFNDHGLFAPGQGFFPRYVRGIYGNMVISAGTANMVPVPRIGNPREIIVIELESDDVKG